MIRTGRLIVARVCLAAAVFAGLALAGIAPVAGQDAGPLIADIQVVGAKRQPAEAVLAKISIRKGTPYDPYKVQESQRLLDATQWYYSVATEVQQTNQGPVIVFRVLERPIIHDIEYQGVSHINRNDLDTLTGLSNGAPMSPAINRKAAQAIEDRLRKDGRLFANVELLEGGNPDDTRVVFKVTEGPVVRISDIRFEGNHFASAGRLKTQILSSENFLWVFRGKYRQEMLDHDVGKIIEYYHNFGFFDVKVRRQLVHNSGYDTVDVVFVIDEGVRYLVRDWDIHGNRKLDNVYLMARNALQKDQPFNGHVVQASAKRMQDEYGSKGFLNTRVVPELKFYEQPGIVTVVYRVLEGPPARVGEIKFAGNYVTRDNVLRRQLLVYPGQIINEPAMRASEANLARLGIFKVIPQEGIVPRITVIDADVEPPPGLPPEDNYKDLVVEIQEDRTGMLVFGVGINSDAGANANIVLHERNFDLTRLPTSFDDILSNRAFRGAGQEFRMEISPGTELNRFVVSFREPYLFDTRYSLGTSAYFYHRRFDEYTERRTGGRVTVGRRLTPAWQVGASFRAEEIKVDDFAFFAPADFFEVRGHNMLYAPRFTLARDTRDSIIMPSAGNYFEVSYEHGFGDFNFPIVSIEDSQYFTLTERADGSGRQILALRGQLGFAGDDTPLFERFYAGGYRTLRGFDFRGVGPDKFGFKVGGTFMMLGSVEYQVPVVPSDQLYAVIFSDFGTVESDVTIRDFRASVGAGLRIKVPMFGPVPLALDWAYPVSKGPFDDTQVFSFGIAVTR